MATKTPAKGKKPAAPKEKAKKPAKAAAKPAALEDEHDGDGDEDEDEDEEMEAAPKPKKPAAKPASGTAGAGGEPPAVVPARRLTPEAKAKVNLAEVDLSSVIAATKK